MKKTLKIIGITLLSVVGGVLIAASILVWVVFTPEKLTPIVRKELNKYLLCETKLDKVDLTFLSTFPYFGLHIENLSLSNSMQGAPSDTLAWINDITATVNVKAFLSENKIILHKFLLKDAVANIFVDSLGNANYNIVKMDSDGNSDTTEFENPFDLIAFESIEIANLNAFYADNQSKMDAHASKFKLALKGEVISLDGQAELSMKAEDIAFNMTDSSNMHAMLSSLDLTFDGEKKESVLTGNLLANLPGVIFEMDSTCYAKSIDLTISTPFSFDIENNKATLTKAEISVADNAVQLDGWIQLPDNGDIVTDISFATGKWNVKRLLALIPDSYASMVKDIHADGELNISGRANGIMNDSLMPKINLTANYQNGALKYNPLPYKFRDMSVQLSAQLDLSKDSVSSAAITSLKAKTGKSAAVISGQIDDLLGTLLCRLKIKADLNLPELKLMLPKDMKAEIEGRATADLNANFKLNDVLNLALNKMKASGKIDFQNLDLKYNDSIFLQTPSLSLGIEMPSPCLNGQFKELLQTTIISPNLTAEMLGTANVEAMRVDMKVGLSDFMDTTRMLSADCDFNMDELALTMDTIMATITKPSGNVMLFPAKHNQKSPALVCTYANESLHAEMGKSMALNTRNIKLSAKADYDDSQTDLLLQWNPELNIDLNNGNVHIAQLPYDVKIPVIKFDFTPGKFVINNSNIILGKSDFSLSGIVTNIDEYIKKTALLTANLDFVSNHTDVTQLMDLVSGFGADKQDSTISKTEKIADTQQEDNPFMVPLGVDVRLNTKVKDALMNRTTINDIGGTLTIKDGVLVLEQMGFTCDAANMQLTAMYRSDRKNHLFAGLDFHLLNIEIDKLIDMVPDIDTIVPMLKSFAGKAEFHLAAETYLKSNYDIKFSTLRGAAAIEGKDLVLMDNETFSSIAKYLLFNKKTTNKVDSLAVEMTVFRDEVDLYPFLIAMDKYQAVINGRYNLTPNYDCHISLVAPIRLDLDVKGNMDDMKFKLFKKGKYGNLYNPEKRNVVQERTLSLKKLISDALKSTIKDIPETMQEK